MFYRHQLSLLIFVFLVALLISLAASIDPVEINTASQDDLELIPGIGPSIASKIILERNRRGGFRTMDDLLKIRGIGRNTLKKLENYLYIHEKMAMKGIAAKSDLPR